MSKLLVANRGEIARRIFRTARSLGIATVAVFSDPDADAAFVGEADEAVRLPGSAAIHTYLDIDVIVAAARATGADAVHPGYGFLSEHAGFARACGAAGIAFVGPPPAVIEAMGSKVAAKRLMAEAGVPVLPGTVVEPGASPEDLQRAGDAIGVPLLVKADFGGGGRGMRIVRSADEIVGAVEAAQREAAAAFGNGLVFLERFVESPRHVEVQIFGDTHGTVVHVFERECSIQRRHQKVIEEAPSPALDDALRAEMCAAAVSAAKAIGYIGAGTVEFVLDPDRRFWFLEVNTRLQVEHPVTELVTGLDLVAVQLEVASGAPLPESVVHATFTGHAIEARLYAEDVPAGFLPTSGPLHRLHFDQLPLDQGGPAVRVDAGYVDGSVVSTFYDGLLAKVIAWAPTRTAAARHLADVLARGEIHGVTTNRDLLVRTLHHPEFVAGDIDTGFFERNDPAALGAPDSSAELTRIHATAAALSLQAASGRGSPLPPGIPPAWRNVGSAAQPIVFETVKTISGSGAVTVTCARGGAAMLVTVDDVPLDGVVVHAADPDAVDMEIAGVRRRIRVHRVDETVYLDSALGSSTLRMLDRFPAPVGGSVTGSLHAPLPGTVTRVLVREGDRVRRGQALLALEAMKMEHTIAA
ncbi:MAG: ATP-grasp domain-containing protein, partial [Acidimicrobiia bacterium]|nr:ATP-grasp domain-containing protein [Acidimicrobiia bacterium]